VDASDPNIDVLRVSNALKEGMKAGELLTNVNGLEIYENAIVFGVSQVRNPGSLRGIDTIKVETQKTQDQSKLN
jgi:hypothetical protein